MTSPDEPVWDGDGTDPWLPVRLAHQETITSGERSIYDDYFARLSSWMVQVQRATLAGPLIDPAAVWRYAPEWLKSMTEFVGTSVLRMAGAAYERIFGPGYRYDQRPYITNYLTQARNRLVRTPDEVYDLVVQQVAEGALAGESVPALRDRVQQTLSTTATPYWPNRAVTVARTETLGAFNAGREGAFRQVAADLDEPFEHAWLATHDERTRPAHRAADFTVPITGQRVPLGQPFLVGGVLLARPGDPDGPADQVINCRCTTLLLEPGEMVDLSNRQFEDF